MVVNLYGLTNFLTIYRGRILKACNAFTTPRDDQIENTAKMAYWSLELIKHTIICIEIQAKEKVVENEIMQNLIMTL